MREILFRGKCNEIGKYNGQWIEGFYAVDDEKPNIGWSTDHGVVGYFCEPESIGQYTGLIDKNGNKIFEGDIIRQKGFVNNYYTSVWYASGRFLVNDYETLLPADLGGISRYKIEVIGNIYDNPELLEVKE